MNFWTIILIILVVGSIFVNVLAFFMDKWYKRKMSRLAANKNRN